MRPQRTLRNLHHGSRQNSWLSGALRVAFAVRCCVSQAAPAPRSWVGRVRVVGAADVIDALGAWRVSGSPDFHRDSIEAVLFGGPPRTFSRSGAERRPGIHSTTAFAARSIPSTPIWSDDRLRALGDVRGQDEAIRPGCHACRCPAVSRLRLNSSPKVPAVSVWASRGLVPLVPAMHSPGDWWASTDNPGAVRGGGSGRGSGPRIGQTASRAARTPPNIPRVTDGEVTQLGSPRGDGASGPAARAAPARRGDTRRRET